MTHAEMTHADKKMNPVGLHFGSNPADIRIRIRINPEIRIRIPDQILALAECALSECSGLHFCVWLCVQRAGDGDHLPGPRCRYTWTYC